MKTQLTYNAGYLHVASPGLPSFEIPMEEKHAAMIEALCHFISQESKREVALAKRDYFAASALNGLLACPQQMCNDIENQAGLAVEYANRLIQELSI